VEDNDTKDDEPDGSADGVDGHVDNDSSGDISD
jgi:hypothetical protein